ncbi:MAG: hypothetical protein AUJ52_05055 [Elusimicrobia bacterium CG1_02_63_36]|nr:MAG: hypothetical protein AUJ52_05055 [Elusimicrobia bacterium CG1_02_63_36]PIP83329.1 MAG: hypothetical protein COR54_10205 [Elusimicrobia bacterium CG22_combo_CG10-13_8_21_14_all_63_91]PJA17968.1 MAG: hypothetical protein COX66_02830 [Elusimicrobia bacterium CG_4_10_14_0_2_um_filter_63_34]PJB26395.1 MAG: hypothetical protein CO113_03725 [Elusimicrobia bacterium CG_4_9_14_3_um_filter_62_55]
MSETVLESMPVRDVLEQLGSLELFRSLPPEEIHALVGEVEPVSFPAGQVLMREGEAPEALYLVMDGQLRVERGAAVVARLDRGGVAGEMALLGDGTRTASVVAETAASALRVLKEGFDRVVVTSPNLRRVLEEIAEGRRPESVPSPEASAATALRAIEARSKQLTLWQAMMGVGLALWASLTLNAHFEWISEHGREMTVAVLNLVTGLLVLQGACEAFIVGVERLGVLGMTAGGARFFLPMNIVTQLLWLLLFPLFYALYQYLELDRSLSNLDAVALTGVYVLLLFFLLTAPV